MPQPSGFPPSPIPDSHKLLSDLQCNILTPHRCGYSAHLFIKLPTPQSAAVGYIQDQISTITWANTHHSRELIRRTEKIALRPQPLRQGVRSFMLSFAGLRAAGLNHPRQGEDAFQAGMKSREPRVTDTTQFPDALATWDASFRAEIHAHILVAADSESQLLAMVRSERAALAAAGAREIPQSERRGVQKRQLMPDGRLHAVEHFGYSDGLGNPTFLQSDTEFARTNWGAGNALPLANVIFSPHLDGRPAGSFCVFRQIEQHPDRFGVLPASDRDRIIGRRQDGTPLFTHADRNRFTYASDPAGAKCPFSSHIRKSNPRGSSSQTRTEADALFARRGMLYDHRFFDPATGAPEPASNRVGMLFLGYMGTIQDQFERILSAWYKDPDFPTAGAGPERLLFAQNQAAAFTTVRGGEYFFVPSRSWLLAVR